MTRIQITSPVVLHVGYSKSGSTTIQRIFDAVASLRQSDRGLMFKQLTSPNALAWDRDACVDFFERELRSARDAGQISVHSHERLSGNPHSGHFDDTVIADRIRSVFADPRIVICIREQCGMIASCYRQYVRVGGVLGLEEYLEPVLDYRIPGFDPSKYEYDRLIGYYVQRFGVDAVHIVLLEDLADDFQRTTADLLAFCGVSDPAPPPVGRTNTGLSDAEIFAKLPQNRRNPPRSSLIPFRPDRGSWLDRIGRSVRPGRRGGEGSVDIDLTIRSRFEGRYADSNARLAKILGRDLDLIGYQMPG